MNEKQRQFPQSVSTGSVETRPGTECNQPKGHKPAFVQPSLTCHGAVIDLTAQFEYSITPDDAEYPYVN
jgi:hypothetical protein